MPRTGNREPSVVGSKALRIVEECDNGISGPRSNRNRDVDGRLSAGRILCRRDLPALDFEPKLSGAWLRPGISNRRYDAVGLGSQARDRQIFRRWADIDNLDRSPGANAGVTAIVPSGSCKSVMTISRRSRCSARSDALSKQRRIRVPPYVGFTRLECGPCSGGRARLGEDVGSIVECDDSDTLARPGLVDGCTRALDASANRPGPSMLNERSSATIRIGDRRGG